MNRAVWLAPLLSSVVLILSACADDGASRPHRAPPQDPPDYHGVPTDDRPPTMIIAPAASPASPASQ